MITSDPALSALLVFLNVAPLALYFLFLGLVNSHASPRRVSSRADFVALTIVMVPLLFWPIPGLVAYGRWWVLVLVVAAGVIAFRRLLPARNAGWVVYNISEGRWRSAWDAAVRAARLDGEWHDKRWVAADGTPVLQYSSLPILRNISVEFASPTLADSYRSAAQRFDTQIARIEQLPSTTGACLWVMGVALMTLPLWILGRHLHDVATALARLFG